MKKILLFSIAIYFACACRHDAVYPAYNFGFEHVHDEGRIATWTILPEGLNYTAASDGRIRKEGRRSLRLKRESGHFRKEFDYAVFLRQLPAESVAGREIELSGWIRTESVAAGFANLYIYNVDDSPRRGFMLEDPDSTSVNGTCGWTHVVVRRAIGENPESVVIGGILKGDGTAWFDGLELRIDGEPVEDSVFPVLSPADRQELRKYVYPLRTFEAEGGDDSDLDILQSLTAGSRVVALGESTHGTSEIFRMKHRIIRYLAENAGFDIFALEANMPESRRLNEYTVHGREDPAALLKELELWPWCTHEMLDMVEWMRRFNAGEPRLLYTGVDMQMWQGAQRELRDAFRTDSAAMRDLKSLAAELSYVDNTSEKFDAVQRMERISTVKVDAVQRMERISTVIGSLERRVELLDVPARQRERLMRDCRLLRQYSEFELVHTEFAASNCYRDLCMAENMLWIKRRNPESRIVAWAHNVHIANRPDKMGAFLRDSLADEYVNFGFAFYEGSYTCNGRRGLESAKAVTPYPGTLECMLELLDEPIFILDIKRMRQDKSPVLERMDNLQFRSVGAEIFRKDFHDGIDMEYFDYLIFIEKTTASCLL